MNANRNETKELEIKENSIRAEHEEQGRGKLIKKINLTQINLTQINLAQITLTKINLNKINLNKRNSYQLTVY